MAVDETSEPAVLLPPSLEVPVVRVEPRRGFAWFRLGEVWDSRELVMFLVWRDIKVRYKQTALGAAWAILQPLLTMVVFSVFFGKLAKLPSDGIPYPLFAFAALLPWNLFATGLNGAAGSLVANAPLLKKVYLPRLAIPLAAVFAVFVDFLVAFVVLLCMMAGYRIVPSANCWLVIPFTLLAIVAALGAGVWLAALNVKYRDVKYVLPFLVQLWMFATPVAYSSSLIKSEWAKTAFAINPMVGVVDGFRYALLGAPAPQLGALVTSAATACVVLLVGMIYFRQTERTFADVL
jgi:lipopolysaccharide transport system permease protein